jgi:hypothetical protein
MRTAAELYLHELDRMRSDSAIADAMSGRKKHTPELLLSLERHDEALRLMFVGLRQHYLDCIASGQLKRWKRVAHAVIDLLGEVPEAKITARQALTHPPASTSGPVER